MHTYKVSFRMSLALFLLVLQIRADFEEDARDEHNSYRKRHGCPALKLDSSLNADCKKYAEELAASNSLKHSSGPYGENLCLTSKPAMTCIKMWYDEISDYDFDKAKFTSGTGHFTQLVWKASTVLGIGKHKNADGTSFVVARYKPQGNMEGEFKENVPRPSRSGNKQDFSKCLLLFTILFSTKLC